MGMAASQARYIALTARKTNIEYEGQQINQSRLMLSNQSANLFNQMLGMKVPTAPSTDEFTTIQYSYSDGINESVIESFYQIGKTNSDYNYVVTSYHYEDIYTGSRKLMTDPQIQATKEDKYTYDPTRNNKNLAVKAILTPTQTGDNSYRITTSDGSMYVFRPVDNTSTKDRNVINAISGEELNAEYFEYDAGTDKYTYTSIDTELNQTVTNFNPNGAASYTHGGNAYTKIDLATIKPEDQAYKNLYALYGSSFEQDVATVKEGGTVTNNYYTYATDNLYAKNNGVADSETNIYKVTNESKDYTLVDLEDAAQRDALVQVYGNAYNKDEKYYVNNGNYVRSSEINNGKLAVNYHDSKLLQNNAATKYYTDGSLNYIKESELNALTVGKSFTVQSAEYTPKISGYAAVGNAPLTQITVSDFKDNKTISTEINQIIKDMQSANGSTSGAESFAKCFNSDGEYIGGIYSFVEAGVVRYTTETDLYRSVASAYTSDIADNGIDGQQSKLAYYNATYISTKITETKNALVETDGAGRFSTIKFEDDSVVYTLNTETYTDEAAYNDAMNEYYYEQEKYNKAIADINAKTEILQAQDRALELRLEQLNTEQSALQNEMEAVKKVVDKHLEQGFKTFGG